MKKDIQILTQKQTLSTEQAQQVIFGIANGSFNQIEITCFMSLLMMRPICIQELEGFRNAFLQLCLPVDLSDFNTLDMCGTGGDGKNTFNISTLASFVAAACNIPVVKHGNYGLSSISGSSNVLEQLGIKFSNNPDFIKNSLDKTGITILHAPLFHPAMKTVSQIRKDLGVKTFFNILGPLINPSKPNHQVIGVYSLEIARVFTYLLQNTKTKFSVVHSIDGYDEISLTSKAKIISNSHEINIDPSNFKGNNLINPIEIFGGETKEKAAEIFMKIISGKGTKAQNNVVAINAATAISLYNNISIENAFDLALEKIKNQEALARLNKLQNLCQQIS